MLYKAFYQSPLGKILLLGNKENLIGLWFEKQKFFGANFSLKRIIKKNTPELQKTKIWLDKYFSGKKVDTKNINLNPQTTPFRKKVFSILEKIPYGHQTTYKEIAKKLSPKKGKNKLYPRAIGGAVAHNPISIFIPCHRVISTKGDLTGYAGGIKRKKKLMELENIS